MLQGKTLVIVVVTLIIGFGAGFTLRPVIVPPSRTTATISPALAPPALAAPRGKEYFAANLEEARRVVAACRDGSVRGDECAHAEQAVTEVEGRDRFKKFMGH